MKAVRETQSCSSHHYLHNSPQMLRKLVDDKGKSVPYKIVHSEDRAFKELMDKNHDPLMDYHKLYAFRFTKL